MASSSVHKDHSPNNPHSCSSESSDSDRDRERDDDNHNHNHNHNLNGRPPSPTNNIHPNQPPFPPPNSLGYPLPPPGYSYGHGQHNYYNPYPYPYAGCPNGYPAGHAHSHPYYYPQGAAGGAYYGSATTMPQYSPGPSRFFRGFLLCSSFILISLLLYTFIINLILRPEAPLYKLDSFSVSNFNAGNSSLTADWVSKITIENPNKILNAYFSNSRVRLFHTPVELAHSFWAESFELETHENTQVYVSLSTNSQNSSLPITQDAMKEIMKERATGSITIGLGLSTFTTFGFRSLSTRSRPIHAFCADIKLNFKGNSTNGTALLNDTNNNCQLVDAIIS